MNQNMLACFNKSLYLFHIFLTKYKGISVDFWAQLSIQLQEKNDKVWMAQLQTKRNAQESREWYDP